MEQTEVDVQVIQAFDKNVNGCMRHNKDIMIAYSDKNKTGIIDLFLSNEQAIKLIEDLTNAVSRNQHER